MNFVAAGLLGVFAAVFSYSGIDGAAIGLAAAAGLALVIDFS